MKLAGAVFSTNEMRGPSWNGALYCETFHKQCFRCQNYVVQKKNWLFL